MNRKIKTRIIKTNGDMIRSLDNIDLAAYIFKLQDDILKQLAQLGIKYHCDEYLSKREINEWLESDASEDKEYWESIKR